MSLHHFDLLLQPRRTVFLGITLHFIGLNLTIQALSHDVNLKVVALSFGIGATAQPPSADSLKNRFIVSKFYRRKFYRH